MREQSRGRTIVGALAAVLLASTSANAQENEITIVLPERPATLEPCQTLYSNIGRVLSGNVTETLTYLNLAEGTVEPLLATSWERIEDNRWRFELRQDVTFHDGAPFNAEAVAASLERQMGGAFVCDNNVKLGGATLTPHVIDADTIEIETSDPLPVLPQLLNLVMIVSPNTPADRMVNEPIGTGPYTLASQSPETIVLERFEDYWGEAPEVAQATYVWRTESALRAAMVEVGEADLTPDIAIQDAVNPDTDFGYLNSETTRLRINTQAPPLDDERVRKALNMAIDWEGLRTLFGEDVLRASQMVVPGISGFNPDIEGWPYDPDQARELLAAAEADGVPVDATMRIIARNGIYPNGNETMEAIAAMWRDAGINVDLSVLDIAAWREYENKPFPADRGPMFLQQQHNNISGDAYSTAFLMYHSDGPTSAISVPKVDELLDQAENAADEERTRLLQETFATVHDEVVADIPMYHMFSYARIAEHIEWRPTVAANSEIRLSDIGIKE